MKKMRYLVKSEKKIMALKNNSRTGRFWQPSENARTAALHLCQQMLISSRQGTLTLIAICAMVPVSNKSFVGEDVTGRNIYLEHTEKERRGEVLERGHKDHALERVPFTGHCQNLPRVYLIPVNQVFHYSLCSSFLKIGNNLE